MFLGTLTRDPPRLGRWQSLRMTAPGLRGKPGGQQPLSEGLGCLSVTNSLVFLIRQPGAKEGARETTERVNLSALQSLTCRLSAKLLISDQSSSAAAFLLSPLPPSTYPESSPSDSH